MIKVGINGFGRIGRLVFRRLFENPDIEVVGINDITDNKTLAHLLKYDSIHKKYWHKVSFEGENSITVNNKSIRTFAIKNPEEIPWKEVGAEIILECSGLFTSREKAELHLKAGAKKVIISAPAKGNDITIVIGVNENEYDKEKHHIISNASCTTNAWVPMVKVLHDNFKIIRGTMTTTHSYTNDQRILDLPHKDLYRTRAACLSLIPTTTGAASQVSKIFPELEGKLSGVAIRVPTPDASLVDFTCIVEKSTTVDEIKKIFKEASETFLKNILEYNEEPIVSTDVIGNPHSCVFNADLIQVIDGTLIKVMAWYDNEWGYSCRLAELTEIVGK
ncbi:MAG: type I glyceraldehyde-3-phosphate dehydrogenase [Candidatus Coatesbacteria bacterium]|nr:type I glyceraldehyde-3-phosphate dehydrogenase [Candidatus Coatesbacteria bacterium]